MSLSPQQLQQNRTDFLEILDSTCQVPEELRNFLDDSDFWEAPASTKYHNAYEGGLVEHSLKVYEQLSLLNYHYMLGFEEGSVAVTALFHDICKVNFYKKVQKSRKMEDGRWVRMSTYEVDDKFPLGHGEKSLFLLVQHGVVLSEQEALAIRHHMGAFGAQGYIEEQTLANAMGKTKLVVGLHIADMMAVWV